MSKLANFLAKPKKYTINNEEIELKPLKVKDLDILTGFQDQSKQGEVLKEMIKRTLKESIPDATDEEINNIGLNHTMNFLEAIIDVNGLEKVVDKKKAAESLSKM